MSRHETQTVPTNANPAHRRPVILLADDDKDMLYALRLRLQESGFSVVTANDSYNALAATVHEKPDVLILDVNMPAGDGFSVQERLHSMGTLRDTPVIYITGDKSNRLDELASQYGAISLFHKPFDTENLIQTIYQVLRPQAA